MSKFFVKNKYYYTYLRIIKRAKQRNSHKGLGFENHHIIPDCFGGTNRDSNMVMLTFREHFICHLLLTKFVKGKRRWHQMHSALGAFVMHNEHYVRTLTSHEYKLAKNSISKSKQGFIWPEKALSKRAKKCRENWKLKTPEELKRHGAKSRGNLASSIPIIFEGVNYTSVTHAMRETGKTRNQIEKIIYPERFRDPIIPKKKPDFSGEKNPRYGKEVTKETRKKIGDKNRGKQTGKFWITHISLKRRTRIYPDDFCKYQNEGWVKGKLQY